FFSFICKNSKRAQRIKQQRPSFKLHCTILFCTTFAPIVNKTYSYMKFLHNRVNKKELRKIVAAEPFRRITLSFYSYVHIENPNELRDKLFTYWNDIKVR